MLILEKFSLKLIKSKGSFLNNLYDYLGLRPFVAHPKIKQCTSYFGVRPKFFLIIVLIFLLILGGVFYFIARGRKKIPPQTSSYRQLDVIVEKFIDAKKDIPIKKDGTEEKIIEYSFKGILTRMWFEKEVVVYEYDLGKKILLDQKEKISLPLNILPFEYFGKKVAKKEELNLGEGELNLFSELKVWCQVSKEEEKPCQVIKWAIYSLLVDQKLGPYAGIVEKVLDWLDVQKNEEGVYHFGQICQIDGKCEKEGVDNRVGLAAIWARYKHFEKTGSPEDLEIIKQDLDTYTDRSKISVLQNDFWNCKFMYDLWQSDTFSSQDRKRIEDICFSSDDTYSHEIEDLVARGTYQERHDLQEVLAAKRFYVTQPAVFSTYGAKMTYFSAYASDAVARFLWKKDSNDLFRAKAYFDRALDAYKSEEENKYMRGRCVLGIASLDLFRANSDSRYVDLAASIFEKEKIDKICLAKEGEVFPNRCQDSLFEQATCSLFANDLFKLTKNVQYQVFSEKIIENLIKRSFDAQGYQGEFKGDGAFYSQGKGTDSKEVNISKSVRDNGLMVGILLEQN